MNNSTSIPNPQQRLLDPRQRLIDPQLGPLDARLGQLETPSVPKFYSFVHTKTTTVQGHDNDYTMSERHLVIENGERSEYVKESRYSGGIMSVSNERGDPLVMNKVSVVNNKFIQ